MYLGLVKLTDAIGLELPCEQVKLSRTRWCVKLKLKRTTGEIVRFFS